MTSPYPLLEQREAQVDQKAEEGFVTKNTLRMPFSKNTQHWFVWDPCGIVCAVVTYILIVYGELVVLMVLAPPFPTIGTAINTFIFSILAFLAVVSHVKAMCTDPVSLVQSLLRSSLWIEVTVHIICTKQDSLPCGFTAS